MHRGRNGENGGRALSTVEGNYRYFLSPDEEAPEGGDGDAAAGGQERLSEAEVEVRPAIHQHGSDVARGRRENVAQGAEEKERNLGR